VKQINQTVVNSYTFLLFKVLKKVTVIDRNNGSQFHAKDCSCKQLVLCCRGNLFE